MNKTTEIEMFFQIASELRQAARNGNGRAARLAREEIEAIKMHADNGALRDRCARVLGC